MSNPLVDAHFICAADPWHPEENPNGYVHLGTAENHLLWDLVGPAIHAVELHEADAHYVDLHGTDACRKALAEFHGRMDPDKMAVASGTSAILDILASKLFAPGDGILVPTPYYSGFVTCLSKRAGVQIVPVHTRSDDGFAISTEMLDAARTAADVPVRGLMLCDPHNPSGVVMKESARDEIIAWAADNDLHVIADEIYHHSIHGDATHRSVLETHPDAEHVHVVYGLAKDAGLSGFKVGALHSNDADLAAAARDAAYLAPVSSQTQATVAAILPAVGDRIKREGPARLAATYQVLLDALDEVGIAYHPAQAGLFALLDLRASLDDSTWEAEDALYQRLFAAKVNIAPGNSFHGDEPGWFRLCFAEPAQKIQEGVRRIASVVSS